MTIPFWCIAVAWLLVYAPRLIVIIGQAKRPEGYDNRNPRDQQAKLEGVPRRAQAAHLNAFESFAPFAAAVLVAHFAGADELWSAVLAVSFCALRAAYILLYVANVASLRTVVWSLAFGAIGALFALPLASL